MSNLVSRNLIYSPSESKIKKFFKNHGVKIALGVATVVAGYFLLKRKPDLICTAAKLAAETAEKTVETADKAKNTVTTTWGRILETLNDKEFLIELSETCDKLVELGSDADKTDEFGIFLDDDIFTLMKETDDALWVMNPVELTKT